MYRKLCYFFALFAAVLLITCKLESVYASDNDDYQSIEDFMMNLGYDADVDSKIPMYDTLHNINGYMYLLSPSGFVVTDENNVVVEANQSLSVENISDDIYYGGYGEYYYKSGDHEYEHIFTGDVISYEKMMESVSLYNSIKEKLSTKTDTMLLSARSGSYISGLPSTFTSSGTDVEGLGVCGYVAAAIYLDYYNRNIYNYSMLPQNYNDGTGKALINALYALGNGGTGISQTDLISVINNFMNNNNKQGYLYMTGVSSDLFSKLCYSINRNRPAIVFIINHEVYSHHAVVGYGYFDVINGQNVSYYFSANDGWGNNGVAINSAYMEAVTYSVD